MTTQDKEMPDAGAAELLPKSPLLITESPDDFDRIRTALNCENTAKWNHRAHVCGGYRAAYLGNSATAALQRFDHKPSISRKRSRNWPLSFYGTLANLNST